MIDWGDVPTWITTLAVGFGAAQLYQDRQATKERTERDARVQARALTAWAGSCRDDEQRDDEYGVVVRNDSGLPFRDVVLTIVWFGDRQEPVELRLLPPGEYFIRSTKSRGWDFPISKEEHGRPVRPYTQTSRYAVTEVHATDAAGRRWRMHDDGRLEDAPGGLAPRRRWARVAGDGGDGGI
ncbi:hypothetical protein [Clavibacter michiganensis]|uniref:hypothetical protein n=1 Tax=Clavibacter michiganensis TaxID=28447 RepID=UPI0009B7F947|nr:hypothetical protein [Clavibacter michiganensis]